jgi:hypothetical protein
MIVSVQFPKWIAAHRDPRAFHQQEAQQRIALLADVAIAGADHRWTLRREPVLRSWHLLLSGKTFERSNH